MVACVGGSSRGGTKGRILYVFWNVKRVNLGHERKKLRILALILETIAMVSPDLCFCQILQVFTWRT